MTEERAHKIYDVLVRTTNAFELYRNSFVYCHSKAEEGCTEWRLLGANLGYGGKYRSKTNTVDCYKEDETPERIKLMKEINNELAKV